MLIVWVLSVFSISGSDVQGVGPAHHGNCPACNLGLDLKWTHVEWCQSLLRRGVDFCSVKLRELGCRVVCRVFFIMCRTSRKGVIHKMAPSVFLSAALLQVSCVNGGLIIHVECIGYPRSSPRMTCHHLCIPSVSGGGGTFSIWMTSSERSSNYIDPLRQVVSHLENFSWLFIAMCRYWLIEEHTIRTRQDSNHRP